MLKQLKWNAALFPRHTQNFISAYSGDNVKTLQAKILCETKISREHLTPEIGLRLITPECRLFFEPINNESRKIFLTEPFWAFYWPGGQGLSRYILDHPNIVESKKILDVGSGCGATSIVSILNKAKYTIANDIDEVAGYAAQLNAELNGVSTKDLKICTDNLIGTKIDVDVIFIGDLFYDEEIAELLLPWLKDLVRAGKEVFIGDPGRHGLTAGRLNFMRKLVTYELPENCCIENNGFKNVSVWKFV